MNKIRPRGGTHYLISATYKLLPLVSFSYRGTILRGNRGLVFFACVYRYWSSSCCNHHACIKPHNKIVKPNLSKRASTHCTQSRYIMWTVDLGCINWCNSLKKSFRLETKIWQHELKICSIMVHKKSKLVLCPFKSENTPEKTWRGGSFHHRAFLCYILSCVLSYFFKIQRFLFLSLCLSVSFTPSFSLPQCV